MQFHVSMDGEKKCYFVHRAVTLSQHNKTETSSRETTLIMSTLTIIIPQSLLML